MGVIYLRVPDSLHLKIREISAEHHRSMNKLLIDILETLIDKEEKEPGYIREIITDGPVHT